ncbi:MAG: 6-phosphogluconolactonase [Clostridia bacterium]|nr:6-phosphogluconolactonase [Clostridia bacterium]
MRRFSEDAALGRYVADRLAEILTAKPNAVICIAAGTTSFPVFDALKERVKAGELSCAKAAFFGMDEWCGLPQDADGAMADFLKKHFLNEMDFGEVFLFDGMADPEAECIRAEQFLADHGGLDAIVFGIGPNGHVALNEPGVDPTLRTHVAQVASSTAVVAQKYFQSKAPALTQGVTIGIQNASDVKTVFLIANSPTKRHAVEEIERFCAEGVVTAQLPATFVAAMPQTEFLVTEAVFN